MKKRQWRRILKTERLSLYQADGEPETFSVRWKRSAGDGGGSRKYGYRVFSAPTVGEATRLAPFISGFEQQPTATKPIRLDEAFDEALNVSRRGERAKYDWERSTKTFTDWLVENHPRVGAWNQVSRAILREYAESMSQLSPNRQRLLMQPIRQTDNYMVLEHGFRPVAQGLATSNATIGEPIEVHLADVLDLLAYLREEKPEFEAPVALCGLAGMRISEAFRQTWKNIDRARWLVQIEDGKTAWSNRVIPVCRDVQEALARAWEAASKRKVREVNEKVYEGCGRADTFGKWISEAIQSWKAKVLWRGGDLRNAIPTWAKSIGRGEDPLIDEYIGHVPKGVTARHYAGRLLAVSRGEQEDLERRMGIVVKTVIRPLERAIEAARKTVKKNAGRRAKKA